MAWHIFSGEKMLQVWESIFGDYFLSESEICGRSVEETSVDLAFPRVGPTLQC